jgi:hypothetical protein
MLATGHEEVDQLDDERVRVVLVVLHECQKCAASLTDRRPFIVDAGEVPHSLQ